MNKLDILNTPDGTIFKVRTVPGSSRDDIGGVMEGALKVRVKAPAEKGRANRQLCEFLARRLGVAKGAVCITTGSAGRIKRVFAAGIDREELLRRLEIGTDGR